MVTGGFFRYDPVTGEYTLPAEHARFLSGPAATNAAPMAAMLQAFAGALPALEECFTTGAGLAPGRSPRTSPRPARSLATHGGGAVPGARRERPRVESDAR